ncbi:unnamed protein product [Mytilus edulis]|uniref:Uncharacterized protein n=1 Tax=Mytilus edulis TaxID=6550 RepID=A0A8S3U5A5_MYTED|nr:unnamed protein product [Mytilus edulis]
MEKASRAIRRSGTKLMSSLGDGTNSDMNVMISEVKNLRNSIKSQINAETSDNLKDYMKMLELVLEGEKHVKEAKIICEVKILNQELKNPRKHIRKGSVEERMSFESKVTQAQKSRDVALLEEPDSDPPPYHTVYPSIYPSLHFITSNRDYSQNQSDHSNNSSPETSICRKDDAESKSTLKYMETKHLLIGKNHSVWTIFDKTKAEVRKAIIKARIVVGTFILNSD